MATLTVNGAQQEVPGGTTLAALLQQMQLSPEHVVAAVNGEIIAAGDTATRMLQDGDQLDLMNFVGGG